MMPERSDNSGCVPVLIALAVGLAFWTIVLAVMSL